MAFDASNPTASGMALTFDDEFNNLSVSADGVQNGTTWTNHLWYMPPGAHADAQSGVLNLYSDGGGNITTVNAAQQGFSQKYGYFEARIWVPGGTGTWPAFWLISTDHAKDANLPASELDIMEGQGASADGYFGTLHRDSSHAGDQMNTNNWIGAGTNVSQGWHDYGVLWDEHSNNVTYYFDDKPVLTVPKFDTTDSSPMSVILGNGIGNMDGANPVTGDTPNPSNMKVDWVHVYQFNDMNPVAVADPNGGSAGVSDPPGDTTGTAGSGSSTPPTTTGPDTLTIHVSGDQWQGDPQFTVLVDGHQVGAAQDVTASHDAGQWQDITLNGNFADAHQVQIAFGNDAFGGAHDQDRNIYVGSVTLDGHQHQGTSGVDTAAGGYEAMEPNAAVMVNNGTLTFDLSNPPSAGSSDPSDGSAGSAGSGSSTPPTTTGPDTLTIHVSGDQWQGDPQFTVLVDGQQVGAAQDVTASHDAGQWQDITLNGDFANAHHVQIAFGNDAYGGTHAEDRNVYVGSITLDGHQYQGTSGVDTAAAGYEATDSNAAVMVTNGVLTFDVSDASSTGTSIPGMGSSTPVDPTTPATGATTPVTDAQGVQTFSDGHGHDLFVLHSAGNTGATISDFHPGEDVLDLTPVLHAIGYTGQDPVADHVLQLTPDASGGTDVMIDPQGVDPSHGQTLVTLANVTPQDLSHSIWH